MNKARKQYIQSCEVSELLTVELGGYKQKILIEGKSKNLPVVICLHGGPGSPVPFSAGCRGLFPEWTVKAIMVYWDQLGCGINNRKIDDSFKIKNFVDMTCDLVNYIKERFPENKLYLFGVSWGSILALESALRVPEKLDGVFVWGQVLKNTLFCDEVFTAFEDAPKSVRARVEKIKADGKDCNDKLLDKNMHSLFKYIGKYTDGNVNKKAEKLPIGKIVMGLLTSPDYSFKDFKAVVNNGYKGNISLWREVVSLDLPASLSAVKIPYKILQGDTDIITPTAAVLKTVAQCGNGNVTVNVIKNSGHMPSADAMEECFNNLLQFIQ